MLEALIALAIIAVALGTIATVSRPSDSAQLQAEAARIANDAAAARLQALTEGRRQVFTPAPAPGVSLAACTDGAATLAFAADGSASGGPLCLSRGAARLELHADWLTGIVEVRIP